MFINIMQLSYIYSFSNTIINYSFKTIFTHISKLLQHSHIYTTYSVETNLGENHKVLFIWHEEIDAPLSAHKAADSIQDILFYLYRIFLPLMLFDILSIYLYPTPTSDPCTSWIDSTFSTCLRTQLQTLYTDALNNTESLQKSLSPV